MLNKTTGFALTSALLFAIYWALVQAIEPRFVIEMTASAIVIGAIAVVRLCIPVVSRILHSGQCSASSRLIIGVFYLMLGVGGENVYRITARVYNAWVREEVLGFFLALIGVGIAFCFLSVRPTIIDRKTWHLVVILTLLSTLAGAIVCGLTVYLHRWN